MAVISTWASVVFALWLLPLYFLGLLVYRLYLSPLAKFPGPTLAAATLWYEYYYDVVKRGRYTWKINDLHARYGPIVRISPYELHIDDPEYPVCSPYARSHVDLRRYYDELYVGSSRRTEKYEWSIRGFGPLLYVFGTVSHELHRVRRGAVAPFFSKTLVQRLEPSVQAMVDKLMSRIETHKDTDAIINLIKMYPCLTADVICQYAFGAPYGYLDEPDFSPRWHQAVMDASEGFHFFKQFPWIESLMRQLPPSTAKKLAPNLASLIQLLEMIHHKVEKVRLDVAEHNHPDHRKTIFHELMMNDQLKAEERTNLRLEAEGVGLVAAGTMTVAHTLSVISYHLIANPGMLQKLQEELEQASQASPSRLTWNELEQLPYLTAIIQEGFRWAPGVPHRLSRVSPDVDLEYKEWLIPRGTPVGMTSVMMHENPELFPQPRTFDPERWLGTDAPRLRRYLVPFSKGSRNCLGMNLAYCELYLTLAAVFAPGRFSFELFETDESDVEIKHDFFNACQDVHSKGIRVKVRSTNISK